MLYICSINNIYLYLRCVSKKCVKHSRWNTNTFLTTTSFQCQFCNTFFTTLHILNQYYTVSRCSAGKYLNSSVSQDFVLLKVLHLFWIVLLLNKNGFCVVEHKFKTIRLVFWNFQFAKFFSNWTFAIKYTKDNDLTGGKHSDTGFQHKLQW